MKSEPLSEEMLPVMRTLGAFMITQGMLANEITGCHKLDVVKVVNIVDEILETLPHGGEL
jgi:hypothetical protein